MKKYIIISMLLMILLLTGCNTKSMNYIINNKPSISGVVTELQDTYIQIYIENEGYPDGADCIVSLDVENEDGLYSPIMIGDEVVVYYDGSIMESYPMQIGTVYAITLKTPADRNVNNEQ